MDSILYEQLIDRGIKLINDVIKRSNFRPKYSTKELEASIFTHFTYIKNETKLISYRETKESKEINDIYIDIDINVKPRSETYPGTFKERFTMEEIINQRNEGLKYKEFTHIILMGGPGAGKTTTVSRICRCFLGENHNFKFKLPILIKLREIPKSITIYGKLIDFLGLSDYENEKASIFNDELLARKIVNAYLNSLNALLVIDGLDEVEPQKLDLYNEEIKDLFNYLDNTLVILTSRSASLNHSFPNSEKYELCDLTDDQVVQFVNNWFDNDNSLVEKFMDNLKDYRFSSLKIQPLTLTHICAVFEKKGKFYRKSRNLYERLINLLIEDWDADRRIKEREEFFEREQYDTEYSKFEVDEKKRFLSHLAYDLKVNYASNIYTTQDIKESYIRIYENHNLPSNQCEKVIREIEAHNGIITNYNVDHFLFSHNVIQEVLAAQHIVRLKKIPINKINNSNISNELALAICLSSDPTDSYLDFVFKDLKNVKLTTTFVSEFLTRLFDEQPNFKRTKLIPLSFIYIYNLLLEKREIKMYDRTENEIFHDLNAVEFNNRFIEIIDEAKKNNHTVFNCFLNFKQFFQVSSSSILGSSICKIKIIEEAYELLGKSEADYLELEYLDSLMPLEIPKNIFNTHF